MRDIDLVFVQTKAGTPHPLSEHTYLVWYACQQMGIETHLFETIDSIAANLKRTTVVSGGVGTVKKALEILGCPEPPILDVPDEILPWFGRKIWKSTLAAIRTEYEQGPFFIKPLQYQKAFDGHLVGPAFNTLIRAAGHPPEMEIWVSEAVSFVSEYRIMVHRGEMMESRHYKGDFTVSPDYSVAREAIAAFKSAPVAYSLDVGVLSDGRTVIVEVNDCFSLGPYGTPPVTYTNMVLDRWCEMVKHE